LCNILHELVELVVNVLETVEFINQHCLDVCRSEENTLKVDITRLEILPRVEHEHHFLQLFIPRFNLFLEHLVVWTHFHTGNISDVLVNAVSKFFPALDELAFLLESRHLKFSSFPSFFTAVQEVLNEGFTTSLCEDFINMNLLC
jgi:hypothetical protein